jgi:putative transposase
MTAATDVQETLEVALAMAKLDRVRVRHRPRLLSDNGPCYVSGQLRWFLKTQRMEPNRGVPYNPKAPGTPGVTHSKIERYHRSMKKLILLHNYVFPCALEQKIARFVDYYNNQHYHESLNNVTPADVYFGRVKEVLTRREEIKRKTLEARRRQQSQSQPMAA